MIRTVWTKHKKDTNALGYYLSAFCCFTTAKKEKFHTHVKGLAALIA
ncbi:hypothetical protein M118_4395 [Bacteroides fragilis str. 3783N1-2]|nr:hypothetical protein M118_4395 [Bacteroides fragilis str. 3783N1-2]